VTFDASPEEIYAIVMDQKKHSAVTGSRVIMSAKVNGRFNIFDGYCHGFNIELIEGKKIVQAWNFREDGWPENHFSVCTFQLEQVGNKTKLRFLQTFVPEHNVNALKEGWKTYYWNTIKEYLQNNK
jgi:activator of HSP90 ATPase